MGYTKIILILGIAALLSVGCKDQGESIKQTKLLKRNLRYTTSSEQTKPQTEAKSIKNRDDSAIKLKEMDLKHKERLALIAAKREKQLKEVELRNRKNELKTKEAISKKEAETRLKIEEQKQKGTIAVERQRYSFYQKMLITLLVLSLLIMIFWYLLYRKKQNLKQILHLEEMRHKEYMQESRQYHERVTKILDIISSSNMDESVKKELAELLKQNPNAKTLPKDL